MGRLAMLFVLAGCRQLLGIDPPIAPTEDARPPQECTTADVTACEPTAPVCGVDNRCRACASDDECPGSVCLPDGSCPPETDIIYVATTGVAAPGCGARDTPCAIMQSIVEVTDTRNIIKLFPNPGQDYLVSGAIGLVLDKTVTIDARGATFGRIGSGGIIAVNSQTTATLLGGVIKGGVGAVGHGIACSSASVLVVVETDIGSNEGDGIHDTQCGTFLDRVVIHGNNLGISKSGGGSLEVTRSTFLANHGGGISIFTNGTRFAILNNMFIANGAAGTGTGGVRIETDTTTTSRLEFNSFNANNATPGIGSGIQCVVSGFVARNNVVFQNGDGSNVNQVEGTCQHTFSIIAPNTPNGTGISGADPLFVLAGANLHTALGSPSEGGGDPASDLSGLAAIDFDGEPRSSPPDLGADQH